MIRRIRFATLTGVFLLIWCCSNALALGNPERKDSARASKLAVETVDLVRRCLQVGLPPTFPARCISAYPDAVNNYDDLQWTLAGRGFYDYVLLKDWNKSLYKDLKRYWAHSDRERYDALPYMADLYLKEENNDVKRLMTGMFYSFISEVLPNHPDTSVLEKPILSMLESESEDERLYGLYVALDKVYSNACPTAFQRLLSLIQRHMNRCRIAGQAFMAYFTVICNHSPNSALADSAIELCAASTCDESRVALLYNASCLEKYQREKLQGLLFSWLPSALCLDTENNAFGAAILRFFTVKSPTMRVLPFLITALDSHDPYLRCDAIIYLRVLSNIPISTLPYRESEATFYWGKIQGVREMTYVESVKNTFLKEHEKAVVFWKEWWLRHQKDFDVSKE